MVNKKFNTICIIGVGLIGGSVACALKNLDAAPAVYGIDIDEKTLAAGLEQGILDEGSLPDGDKAARWTAKGGCDLIILATPVFAAEDWFASLGERGFDGVITDVASTKCVISDLAGSKLAYLDRYIPGHPMAGSETSGIESASAALFQGAYWILCPNGQTDPDSYQALHELIVRLGARVISIDRASHDNAVAIVSHVPHMVASATVRLAGLHANEQSELLRLAAGGFKDSTRIAAGSPKLWCGIALDNQAALADGLRELGGILADFETSIREGDDRALTELLQYSADIRRNLPTKWVPDSSRLVQCRIPMANRNGVIAEVTGIASHAGCNIQSIDIDHINEASAVLELIFTDEGDIGRLSKELIDAGYDFSFSPLGARE